MKCSRCQSKLDRESRTERRKTCTRCRNYNRKNRHRWRDNRGRHDGGPHPPKPLKRTPAVVCGRRFCSDCGRWRHIHEFGVAQWVDSIKRDAPLYFRNYCHCCERIRGRKRNARLAGRKKPYGQRRYGSRISKQEKARRAYLNRRKKMESDPEYAENYRERQRIYAEGIRRKKGVPRRDALLDKRRVAPFPSADESLPAGPLQEWITERLRNGPYFNIEELAAKCGVDRELLAKIHRGTKHTLAFGTVDRILIAEDTTNMWELYPQAVGDVDVALVA